MSISKVFKSGLILLALCTAAGVFAAPWIANGPKRDVVTLVIAGNYKSPRLLAELILNESRQPYLLLPTPESKIQKIIFVQAKGPAREISEQKLKQFVEFLNPQRIVVLGDERYVQPKFLKLLDRSIPIVRIEGDDWNRIAEETTYLLSLSHLGDNYKRLREELTSKGKFLRPTPRTHQQQPEPQQAAPADEPQVVEDVIVEEAAAETAE
ncbi:MAG: hypothetical protein HPZ91_02585 [Lentisphaeria bacterium]|nr:hypothetical protein [Lentisphaeria bacterium]